MIKLTLQEQKSAMEALFRGDSLRRSTRRSGVPRNRIKALVMDLGLACARFQHDALGGMDVELLSIRANPAFRAKQHPAPNGKGTASAPNSVWIWTYTDPKSRMVPFWVTGPEDVRVLGEFLSLPPSGSVRIGADRLSQIRLADANSAACSAPGLGSNSRDDTTEILALRISIAWFSSLPRAAALNAKHYAAGIALYFMYHNFVRVHGSLGLTPAMAAGIVRRPWNVEDVLGLLKNSSTIARHQNSSTGSRSV